MSRADGRKVKTIPAFNRIIPYLMWTRTDSMNMIKDEFNCEAWDDYVSKKSEEGITIDYLSIVVTAMMRTIALRPMLNRFVMKGRVYTRDKIWVSYAIQRTLKDEEQSNETTVKLGFEGVETVEDVAEVINNEVRKNKEEVQENSTDKVAKIITSVPGFLVRFVVWVIKCLDRNNLLPGSIISASPFHTTFFVTNLRSIGLNYIYHHLYEFGTTGIFLALGKEKMRAVVENGEIVARKMITVGVVLDERYCDGLYFARSLRLLRKYLQSPELLDKPLDEKIEDSL